MTTVDPYIYIRKADGSDSFSLHNGLYGAATTALHALTRNFEDGTISGPWHSSCIDTTGKGTIVRSILADISELDPPHHRPGTWATFAAFQQATSDDADYAIKAIEPDGGTHMDQDAGQREYRPGLWMIQFTALDAQRATDYARQSAAGDGALVVRTAGRYGFAAVGTHRQVIALRDVAMADGESFAITRAIMAELYPDGQLLSYQGSDPGAFRERARTRLGLDPADDDRWELIRQFWCSAKVLDIVLTDYSQWELRQEDDD